MKTTPKRSSIDTEVPPGYLTHARIPKAFLKAEVGDQESLVAYVKAMPGNFLKFGRGMLLLGPHGSGKTYSACAVAIQALRFTTKVLYLTAPALIEALKPDAAPFDEITSMLSAMENRRLLVIDDLGAEYRGSGSGFSEQQLINLMRHRVQNRRATIITTNLLGERLEEIYGPGLRSLLNEVGPAVKLTGRDKRTTTEMIRRVKKESGIG